MTKETKKELTPVFGYIYFIDKFNKELSEQTSEEFLQEIEKNKTLQNEIATAAADETDKYQAFWTKAERLTSVQSAKGGTKLEKLKTLRSLKKMPKKAATKCKCGCDMVEAKDKGGKIVNKCSCNCGGGKVRMKSKGGILDENDIHNMLRSGLIDSSIVNKWDREMHKGKLGKFKK